IRHGYHCQFAFPVFAIIGLGYAAGHLRILDPASAEALNKFVYYFALPPVLFVFTAKAPVDEIFYLAVYWDVSGGCHRHLGGLCHCRKLRCKDWLRYSQTPPIWASRFS
ncbi:MAG: AEC family transporter, partial [Pseudomonadota bacterium]|nr:AEC family transporter [Pseudomonadota bacterium]